MALITPLRDGMNLVAKEFVACQDDDDPGVLILSPFAGAGGIMQEALQVSGHQGSQILLHLGFVVERSQCKIFVNKSKCKRT